MCVYTTWTRWLSPSPMWTLGMELRSLGLAASAFICWAILLPNFCFFWGRFSLCGPELFILPPQLPECLGHRLPYTSTKCFASVTYANCKDCIPTYINESKIILLKMLQFNRQKLHSYCKNKELWMNWVYRTIYTWKWLKWSLPLTIQFLWKHLVMMATQYL